MANEKGKKKDNDKDKDKDKDKVILTPQKDGKTTVHIDGNIKGTLPSQESRIAPTVSSEFATSSVAPQEENGSFAIAISRAAQLEIAEALSTGPETLTTLASSKIRAVRLAVAKNPYAPVYALNLLATEAETDILVAVASHKNTEAGLLDKLAKNPAQEVHLAVAKNPNTPPEIIHSILINCATDTDILVAVASHRNTAAGILDRLAKNPAWEVREAVASNSTQFDWKTIVDLAYDEDPEVTVALIRSGKIDKTELLTDIGLDSNAGYSVQIVAASHPGNYSDVLDLFVSKYPSDPILMLAVVENPTTEHDTLERLLESEDHRVVAKTKVRLGLNPSLA